MRRLIFIIGLAFICNSVQGQDFVASSPEYNLLYRGYNNKLILGALNNSADFNIVSDDCTISKIEGNTYYVRASGRSRTATIKFTNDDKQILDSIVFRVGNLPKPSLFLCHSQGNQSKISVSCRQISVGYPANIALNLKRESWRISSLSASYNGEELGEFNADQLNTLFDTISSKRKVGTITDAQLIIRALIYGPDGIARRISGKWILLPPTTTYYENDTVKSKLSYDSYGNLDGPCVFYYENGQIKEELNYSNGQPSGTCKYYYENGQLLKEINYAESNGALLGESIVIYYENGAKMSEENLKTMDYVSYYENGKIKSQGRLAISYESMMDELVQHGTWEYINPKGQLDCTVEYDWGLVSKKSGKCKTFE